MQLDQHLAEFEGLDPEERLELLVDFAESLPPPTESETARLNVGDCRVQECQTPVDLWVRVVEGRAQLAARVPDKSPTVRGFVALLVTGLSGEPVDKVVQLSDRLLDRLGISEILGMQRHRGFRAIIARIVHDVAQAAAREAAGD